MKICLLSGLFKEHIIGGGEIYVQRIAKELSKDNEVIIITTSPDAKQEPLIANDGNIRVYTYRPLSYGYDINSVDSLENVMKALYTTFLDLYNPFSSKIVKSILKKENPDIVHTHNVGYVSTSIFSAINALGIPCIHTCHSYQLLSIWPSLYNYNTKSLVKNSNFLDRRYMDIKRYQTKSINAVTAPSKFVLDMHISHGFFENSGQIVLPLGIDIKDIKTNTKNYDTIDILFVGRLVYIKGVDILIKAFKRLGHCNARLHICGKGPEEARIKELIGSDDRINFYGFVSDDKLAELYHLANIVVVPSIWYDNSPFVIYESFKNGIPVIGSRMGGIPELVKNGYNGLLFDAGDVDGLKNSLLYLIEDRETLRKWEINAINSVKNYDLSKHIIELMQIYKKYM